IVGTVNLIVPDKFCSSPFSASSAFFAASYTFFAPTKSLLPASVKKSFLVVLYKS
ncbi:hypothetical protein D050_4891B, partial [Vibrio parahaemolyticus VPCR-2009]